VSALDGLCLGLKVVNPLPKLFSDLWPSRDPARLAASPGQRPKSLTVHRNRRPFLASLFGNENWRASASDLDENRSVIGRLSPLGLLDVTGRQKRGGLRFRRLPRRTRKRSDA